MVEILILALALSMDAFAVSIGLGSKQHKPLKVMALMAATYFGIFQGVMPLLGYLGGRGVFGWIESFAPWVAWFLLMLIGAKMIYESFAEDIEEDLSNITHKVMLTLAIATSIDAMAAGFSLTLMAINPFLACLIIGVITFLFSALGVIVGKVSGTWLESKAELLGGVVLILIGFKILLI